MCKINSFQKFFFVSLLFAGAMCVGVSNAQNIVFVDPNFKAALLSDTGIPKWDANGDGEISIAEAATTNKQTLNVSGKNISAMPEIKYFINLTYLNCSNNNLTKLDVSYNPKLNQFFCFNNQLTELIVGNQTNLANFSCYNNQLTTLDLSNTHVGIVDCFNNQLTELNLKNNNLAMLNCSNNLLTELDVSNQTALSMLVCGGNPLTSLNINNGRTKSYSNATDPMDIANNLNKYNFINTPNLVDICVECNQIAAVKSYVSANSIGNSPVVKDCTSPIINIPDANFKAALIAAGVDVDGDNEFSNCEMEQVTTLDVSGNNIASLQGIEYFTNLLTLNCSNNLLTAPLNLSSNTKLTTLSCYENQLTGLDISNNLAMQVLSCYSNKLTSLDISNNVALTSLDAFDNQLSTLDVSQNVNLKILFCNSNQLSDLDVSNNVNLLSFSCAENQLTVLDVSTNTLLQELYCNDNQLMTLNVSNCADLQWLFCYNNQLTSLYMKNGSDEFAYDFSGNPDLAIICCDESQLQEVQDYVTQNSIGNNPTIDSYCGIVTGIDNVLAYEINIYPNPVRDELRIDGDVPFDNLPFTILDLTGKQIVNGQWLNGKSINVSTLPSGIYFLKIQTDKGAVTRKFVKE